MELKFVAARKPVAIDVALLRRRRVVQRIDQQISILKSANESQSPRSSWVWMDEAGTYFVSIKYGRQSVELAKGMYAIQCDTVDQVPTAFELVRAMVLNGHFDKQLAQASQQIRAKFGKGTAATSD